ncbi:unnamed protein product [Prunus armeniaca]
MGGRLSSNVKRHTVKNVTLAVDTVPETIENETVKSKVPSAEGGFGLVFKEWIDENSLTAAESGTGMAIAVKRLNKEGLHGQKEWLDSCRFLAYEFMPRGSLDNHLFRISTAPMEPSHQIALGAAKGLAFLHSVEAKVIYGNFKTSKILLDSNYNAKLSGYGLAKEGLQGYSMLQLSDCSCSNSNKFYHEEEDLTPEGDVYSFGVVLLEILSGRRALDANRPSGEQDLVQHARSAKKCKLHQLFDARNEGQSSSDEDRKALNLAMKCLSTDS